MPRPPAWLPRTVEFPTPSLSSSLSPVAEALRPLLGLLGWAWLLPEGHLHPRAGSATERGTGYPPEALTLTGSSHSSVTRQRCPPDPRLSSHAGDFCSRAWLGPVGARGSHPRAQEHRALVLLAPTLPRSRWTLASVCPRWASNFVLPWALPLIRPPTGKTSRAEALSKTSLKSELARPHSPRPSPSQWAVWPGFVPPTPLSLSLPLLFLPFLPPSIPGEESSAKCPHCEGN